MLHAKVYAEHRARFMESMGENSVALLSSPPQRQRNGDATYAYRQSSDVHYLTGFDEPGTTVVLRPGDETPFVLFVPPKDPEREVWDGRRAGIEGAKRDFAADVAYPNTELVERLKSFIANVDDLYYEVGVDAARDRMVFKTIAQLRTSERRGLRPPRRIVDPRWTLHEQRLRKGEAEVAKLRKAASITTKAHRAAMATVRPSMFEYELEALVDYEFRRAGGMGPGYTSIVAGGANATILHYVENSAVIRDGDLVLIDAGCEFDFYTADVTRTFPANGRFSDPQRKCYEVVLEAITEGIAMVRPGVTIDDIHGRCVEILTQGMVRLGLLKGSVAECIEKESYKEFYMHRTSHWLGMDVHDVGWYTVDGKPRPLKPGMVLTVEPGLYIAADAEDIPSEYKGIGIRIEDDILVTEAGHENLTAQVPKSIPEVEALCAGS